jgi:septum formation protein
MRLILASASPRRAELLTAAGYAFETAAVDIDERTRPGESAAEYVRRLAMEKSGAAALARAALREDAAHTGSDAAVILGADTTVVVGDQILGKPHDGRDVARMLRLLSGRPHHVMTGISVRTRDAEMGLVETTTVWFSPLNDAEIEWYVESGEGLDKAGGYAIQGMAARLIPRIEGSYSNVVGLPIAAVHGILSRLAGPA